MHWDDDSYLLRKLPKGTRLDVLDKGAGESFNQTAETYHWWKVRAIGTDGWVMQALLDDVTGSP
jgi:SH3-like domain-containing protein